MDLSSKLALVTGSSSGVGKEACCALVKEGCTVVMASRVAEKGEIARRDILQRTNADESKLVVVQVDLADLESVNTFRSRYDAVPGLKDRPIDILILNAGILPPRKAEYTKQGNEAQMGISVLGHFKLLSEMFDLCKASQNCRIVVTGSAAHATVRNIDFDDFNRTKKYRKFQVYAESKLGTLLFMRKLNRLLLQRGMNNIVAVAAHPGYSDTKLHKQTVFKYFKGFVQSAETGAQNLVKAATDPNAKRDDFCGPSGLLEVRGAPAWGRHTGTAVEDKSLQDHFWEKCEELTNAKLATKIGSS